MNINWDAEKYTKNFSFVHQYGEGVLELIDIRDGMTVLDLGCGNGALTSRLNEMGANVFGMDSSHDLIEKAREKYPHIRFIEGDAVNYVLESPVDAVFSNAVFHWIDKDKQQDMLKCVFDSLKVGGQFVFEFGGYGNNYIIHKSLEKAFTEHGLEYKMPFYFPTIGEYTSLMEKTGFKVVYAVLFDRMTELSKEDGLYGWIDMFVKTPFENISGEKKDILIKQAVSYAKGELYRNGIWYADYVRIRCKAVKE